MSYFIGRNTVVKLGLLLILIFALIEFAPSLISIVTNVQFAVAMALITFVVVAPISKVAWIGILTTFAAIISPSPLLPAITSITGNIFYVISVVFVGALMLNKIIKANYAILCSIVVLGFQLCAVVYWAEAKLIILPFYFLSALLLASAMQPSELNKFIIYSSNILLLLLIGGAIGFTYALVFGGQPLLYITNEDTRQNGLYLTTFSNWYVRGIIRPSGIYDEPGALSFIICLIAAIRDNMGASKKLTWTLLILGLLTLSMAHIIYMVLHLAEQLRRKRYKLNITHLITFSLFIGVTLSSPLGAVINEFIFGRFAIVDGTIQGDNRSALLINAYNYLSWPVFFFGIDADCIVKPAACAGKSYLQFGDNPLGPLVLGGIVQFLPYYGVVIILLISAIKRRSAIILGVALLLLQRNEVMSYGYSLLTAIFLIVMIKREMLLRWGESKRRGHIVDTTTFIQS